MNLRRLFVRSAFRFAETVAAVQESLHGDTPRPHEILLLTAYTPNIAGYGEIAAENRRAYAARHGHPVQIHTDGFDASRPPAWSKVRFVQRALRRHPYVFWLDADALIMNSQIRIDSILAPRYDVFLTRALAPYPHINTGGMLFRSTAFTRLFLEMVWRLEVFSRDFTWEQRAFNYLLDHYSFRRVKVVPNRVFNALGHVPDDPDPYQPGDFIVHFPGVPDRTRLMHDYAARVR